MDKYSIIAIATILVVGLFLSFPSVAEPSEDYEHVGLVTNIEKSSKGYTFDLQGADGMVRCYYSERPDEAYYGISGELSDDGRIFFVSSMKAIG